MRKEKMQAFCKLETPFDLENGGWEKTYPRPQMKRDSFFSLCGAWSLSVQKEESVTALGEITVPYPPESALSGIERALGKGEKWLYEKSFTLPEGFCFEGGRVLLHFGAVDQIAEVSLNGKALLRHEGGYSPFSVDITDAVSENNYLQVLVTDDLDLS
ncbi:MAG: glycoside hydrolase family 2, partial [Clostridia bacterium]|nr:glycoside hydrolase family 2 [Clostridia bacterium]